MLPTSRLWTTLAILSGSLGAHGRALAAPGPPTASPPTQAEPSTSTGGYWLSIDMVGAAQDRADAVTSLQVDLRGARVPTDATPPGVFIGSTRAVQTGLAWVARHAFTAAVSTDEPPRIATTAAPVPGGALLDRHQVMVRAFVISGATPEGGLRPIDWPTDQRLVLPATLPWTPAGLMADHAPLFAAPAAIVPPAAQRHAMAHRSGGLFVLGWLDRCTERQADRRPRCLRWAQVVARDGDRFTPGYLPAYLVAPHEGWVRGAGLLPRAQVLRSGVVDGIAQLLVLARDRHGALHRKRLTGPMREQSFPATRVRVRGDVATIEIEGEPAQALALDATLDLRIRGSSSDPAISPAPTPL